MGVAAILLAAGRARRFGAGEDDSKVVALFDGEPLVRRIAAMALASRAAPLVVVTGHAAQAVTDALAGLPIPIVHNPAYADGMAGSLRAGLAALPDEATGVLVLLGDMPLVTRHTLDALIATFESAPDTLAAVVPTFQGRGGNPVLISRAMFPALDALRGDEGARRLLAAPGRRVASCPVADRGIEIDVDTPAALAALAQGGT